MTLLDFFSLIKKKWYIIVIVPILFAAITGVYCWQMMEDQYTSSVDLYVLSKTGDENTQVTQSDMSASQQLANDIAVLASSNKVKNSTAEALQMNSLSDYKINVKSATNNRVITVAVTGRQPQAVAMVANELSNQLSSTAKEVMELKAVNVVDKAEVPSSPSGPPRLKYTLIALGVGLALAIILVVVMDFFNMTLRTPEEAESVLGLPVIGKLPKVRK